MADKKVRLDELQPYDINGEKTKIVELYTVHNKTLTYIANALGKSASYVSRVLHEAYQEDKSQRDIRILAHSQMLQWLMTKTVDRIEKSGAKWDRRDGEFLLKLSEQERKLKGLDQPVQHEVKVEVEHFTDEELILQLNQMGMHVSLPEHTSPLALPEPVEDAQFEPVRQEQPPQTRPDQAPEGSGSGVG